MADAPGDFIAEQLTNIVGIEMPIARLIGKWKVSQNRPEVDRLGAIAGLRPSGPQGRRRHGRFVSARVTGGEP